MSERKSRFSTLPFLIVLIVLLNWQFILLSSQHGETVVPDHRDTERRVMAKHYHACPIYWDKSLLYDLLQEESVTCIADESASATVYHMGQNWIAYGWGLRGGNRFKNKEEAKRSLETQIAQWNQRPSLPNLRKVLLWKIWVQP